MSAPFDPRRTVSRSSLLLLSFLVACSADDAEVVVEAEAGGWATPVAVERPAPRRSEPVASPRGPCPVEMVQVGGFCVDRYEAHLRVADGKAHPHHRRPSPGVRYVAVSAPGGFPQSYISRDEAAAACAQAGKRLCTRAEWMLACRGTPAVARPEGRACNHGKPHLLTLLGRGYDYERDFNDPRLILEPGFLAEAGAHGDCTSSAEVHDMVGNLHEWVSDAVTPAFLRAFEAEMPRQFQYVAVGNAVFMGGFFSTRAELGPGCWFTTVAHDAGYHDYSTGFRCCGDVVGER